MIEPPWIKYPNYPPYDTFWRQAGEYWFAYVWEPFWLNLTPSEQANYVQKWNPPQVWMNFYFDTKWLNDNDK